jgi:hypothetical protein
MSYTLQIHWHFILVRSVLKELHQGVFTNQNNWLHCNTVKPAHVLTCIKRSHMNCLHAVILDREVIKLKNVTKCIIIVHFSLLIL